MHNLYFGRRKLAEVVPDDRWSGMWRVKLPNGQLSDMVNLTRAKDAAMALARKVEPKLLGGGRQTKSLKWKQTKRAHGAATDVFSARML